VSHRPSYLYFVPRLIRTLLRRPATVAFPYGPLELPSAYRGHVLVDMDSCQGCGLCVRDCPAAALEIERLGGEGLRMVHYFDRCVGCGQCELGCRYGAIRLQPVFKTGTASRSALQIEWIKRGSNE